MSSNQTYSKARFFFAQVEGLGIGKAMTGAVVGNLDLCSRLSAHLDMVQMHHGANATIIGRQ